jgi:hypothetical protein
MYEELKRRRSEVNTLKLDLKMWNQRGEKHNQDLIMIQKASEMKDEQFHRQMQDHKRERNKLTLELDRLSKLVEAQAKKLGGPVNLQVENQALRDEREILLRKIELLTPANSDNPDVVKKVADIESQRKLLVKENEYLYKMENMATQQNIGANKKIADLEEKVKELNEQNQQYLEKLFKNRDKNQTDAYKFVKETLDKQQLHHQEDLVRQRDNIVSEYEARITLLRDQRDEAELKQKRIEKEYALLKVIVLYVE